MGTAAEFAAKAAIKRNDCLVGPVAATYKKRAVTGIRMQWEADRKKRPAWVPVINFLVPDGCKLVPIIR